MTAELKPCPFCGGRAKHEQRAVGIEEIRCTECANGTRWYSGKEIAIKIWNHRPIEDALRAEFAAMTNERNDFATRFNQAVLDHAEASKANAKWYAELAAERARLEWCIGTMISKCGQFLWLDGVEGVHIPEGQTARDVIDKLLHG